jgi:DNA-binding NarL/FixJ family response regulator
MARLSEQERKILQLIAAGKTNRDIATALELSQHTVKTYVSSALKKLGLASRAEAAAFIVRRTSESES